MHINLKYTMMTLPHRINTFYSAILKKTFIIILNSLLLFIVSCKKKETTQPSSQNQTTSKVWCFYQTNFGNKAFYYCAKSESEMQAKQQECINNQLQIVIEIKNKIGRAHV